MAKFNATLKIILDTNDIIKLLKGENILGDGIIIDLDRLDKIHYKLVLEKEDKDEINLGKSS